jgi:ACR3 family arsenite transporter
VVLFASQSKRITSNIGKVLYSAVPLLIYFLFMFLFSFFMSYKFGATYAQSVTLAFTAASNNFELALAIAIASFGLKSDQALMSVVGALIEIPTMLALVYLAFGLRKHLFHEGKCTQRAETLSNPLVQKPTLDSAGVASIDVEVMTEVEQTGNYSSMK